jgi:hypothetical protein
MYLAATETQLSMPKGMTGGISNLKRRRTRWRHAYRPDEPDTLCGRPLDAENIIVTDDGFASVSWPKRCPRCRRIVDGGPAV